MKALDEIRGRWEAATPGPWAVEEDDDGFDGHSVYEDDGITWGRAYVCREMHQGEDEGKSDAEFIAHAPTDIARLLAAVEGVLAKHQLVESPDGDGWFLWECDECGYEPDDKEPCPTAQAIASALEATA